MRVAISPVSLYPFVSIVRLNDRFSEKFAPRSYYCRTRNLTMAFPHDSNLQVARLLQFLEFRHPEFRLAAAYHLRPPHLKIGSLVYPIATILYLYNCDILPQLPIRFYTPCIYRAAQSLLNVLRAD